MCIKTTSERVGTAQIFTAILGILSAGSVSCTSHPPDAVSSATVDIGDPLGMGAEGEAKALMVLAASPSGSTAKVSRVIADELGALVVGPDRGDLVSSGDFPIVGFGSGIFSEKHHPALLALVDELPQVQGGKVFIFSTYGAPANLLGPKEIAEYTDKNHATLRKKLREKGYEIIDEFACPGFNDNSFLKLFGGLNKGRPNAADLEQAKSFAKGLTQYLSTPAVDS